MDFINDLHLEDWGFFFGIILLTFLVATVFGRLYRRFVLGSIAEVTADPTNYKFLMHTITATIYIVGFGLAIYRLDALRSVAGSILATAGILAVAVGFAAQHALSNVVSGVFIVMFKPYRVNDRIQIRNGLEGIVEDITLRHTVIRDYENKRIMVPNALISDEILVNFDISDPKMCLRLEFGISYDSDIDRARIIIREEAEAHPFSLDHRSEADKEQSKPIIPIRLIRWDDSSIVMRAWIWANNQDEAYIMKTDLLESTKKRFDKEGIEIPFPHRTLVYKHSSERNEA